MALALPAQCSIGPNALCQSAIVGAPTWWAAGHTGGTGLADLHPVSLMLDEDKAQENQPLFGGVPGQTAPVSFERPADTGINGALHGTGIAGVIVATGATGCTQCQSSDANERGIAYGLNHFLDPWGTSLDSFRWGLGIAQDDQYGNLVSGAAHPASIVSTSYGYAADMSDEPESFGLFSSQYGVVITASSGNDGSSSVVSSPCIQRDLICVGGTNATEDAMADFSNRGPSPAGRKKPDIVAPAVGGYATSLWQTTGSLWKGDSGTSFASPTVAGGAALVEGAGITDPLAVKALLLDSAELGRSTPTAPMGSQVGWQPDWGWGGLDLTAAYQQRTNLISGRVGGSSSGDGGVRFYRAPTGANADRATLVWAQRGTVAENEWNTGYTFTRNTMSNLDLFALDPTTGATRASSTSSIDNVEQVRAPDTASLIYEVKNEGPVDGALSEPFAVAAARALTPLMNPQPTVSLSRSAVTLDRGQSATLTATITNPSGDLTAENTTLAVTVPAGFSVSGDPASETVGALDQNQSISRTYTITDVSGARGASSPVSVTARASRYGANFYGTGTMTVSTPAPPPPPSPPPTPTPTPTPTPPAVTTLPPAVKPTPQPPVTPHRVVRYVPGLSATRIGWTRGYRYLTFNLAANHALPRTVAITMVCGRSRAHGYAHVRRAHRRYRIRVRLTTTCRRTTRGTLYVRYPGSSRLHSQTRHWRLRARRHR